VRTRSSGTGAARSDSAAGDADAGSAALATYGEAKLAGLCALKRRWDADNGRPFRILPADA
jgi:hypothetical protein